MSKPRLHAQVDNEPGDPKRSRRALCGRLELLDGRLDRRTGRLEMTRDHALVMAENVDHRPRCRDCVGRLEEQRRAHARWRSLVAPAVHATKQPPVAPELAAIAERDRAGTAPTGPRWRGRKASLLHWSRVTDDGSPIRSSDIEAKASRVQESARSPSPGAGRDDSITVEKAIERACRIVSERIAVGRIGIAASFTVPELRSILVWPEIGRPIRKQIAPDRKGTTNARVGCDVAETARLLGDRRGRIVSCDDVETAHREVAAEYDAEMRRVGEMEAARPRKPYERKDMTEWDPARRLRERREREAKIASG